MTATKILCTLGPATDVPDMVLNLAKAGMDAARVNFSHGGKEEQRPRIEAVRAAEIKLGRTIAIIADMQGPKIRIGRFPDGPVELEEGQQVTLVAGDGPCTKDRLTVDYPELADAVTVGQRVFLADGFLHLDVEAVSGKDVICRVFRGGRLSDRKGVNLPGIPLNMPTSTERDFRDALDAAALGCDMIALSFVRNAEDVETLRNFLFAHRVTLPIVVKLERPEAIDNLEAIMKTADAVMVARGDLGVEVGVAQVPVLQKRILRMAKQMGKPAIVATQMLESMTVSPLPTRAEASDVANAILDGADVVMLSGETAAGKYPLETVRMMASIAGEVEPMVQMQKTIRAESHIHSVAEAVVDGLMAMVEDLQAKAIVTYTTSGSTARLLAKRRPRVPIIAITPNETVSRQCSIYYNCRSVEVRPISNTDEIFEMADKLLCKNGFAKKGDQIIIVAGLPFGKAGMTNLIHVHQVCEV